MAISVRLDVNRDAYFPTGGAVTDATNLLRVDRQFFQGYNGGTVSANRLFSTANGYSYSVAATAAVSDSGLQIGAQFSTATFAIPVNSGSPLNVRLVLAGDAGYDIAWQVRTVGGAVHSAVTTVTLGSGTEHTSSVTFTPDDVWVYINVYRTGSTDAMNFTVTRVFITHDTLPTVFNTGYATDAYEDVTDLVLSAQWNTGLDNDQQDIAAPSRCTITFDNKDGHFNQDIIGAELITNGNFSAWTAGDPDGWTVAGEVGGVIEVTQVGFDSLYGGTGSGACNIYDFNSSNKITLTQSVLTVGKTYLLTYDLGAIVTDGNVVNGGGITFFTGSARIAPRQLVTGHHEIVFTATHADFIIGNDRYGTNTTIDNVSVKEVPRYYGLRRNTMVAIFDQYSSTSYTYYRGRLNKLTLQGGAFKTKTATMEFIDGLVDLSDLEYKPTRVNSNITTDQALDNLFGQILFTWPYTSSYWFLDQSVLDEDTWLFDAPEVFTATGSTTLTYEGDVASNREKGIAAMSYVRDVVAAEMGGRFYMSPTSGQLTFYGRNVDNTRLTDTITLTDDDYDDFEMAYADDVVNQATIWYKQRREAQSNVVLWASDQSITVDAKSSKRITGRYRDPSDQSTQVSALSTENLVRGVDYVVSPTTNQNLVTVVATPGAQSVTFEIRNDRKAAVTITTLQIRGLPIYALTEQSIEASNAESIYDHDPKSVTYNIPLLSSPDDALAMATGLVNLYRKPLARLRSITFNADTSSTRQTMSRYPTIIGTRVAINHSTLSNSQSYIVVGTRNTIVGGVNPLYTVTWNLKPIGRVAYWYLGVAGRSELGITTTPAF